MKHNVNVNFEPMDLRSEIENIVHEILMEGVTKEDAVKELLNLHSVSGCFTADDMKNEAIKFAMWCKQRKVFVYEYESNAHYNEKPYNEFKENYC